MVINIYHSRRTNFRKCIFWTASDTRDWNEWTTRNAPVGVFYAKEVSPLSSQGLPVQNAILVNQTYVTLETNDKIVSLTKGCIIKYLHNLWMVDSIQATPHLKESQYTGEEAGTYTVSIRR